MPQNTPGDQNEFLPISWEILGHPKVLCHVTCQVLCHVTFNFSGEQIRGRERRYKRLKQNISNRKYILDIFSALDYPIEFIPFGLFQASQDTSFEYPKHINQR